MLTIMQPIEMLGTDIFRSRLIFVILFDFFDLQKCKSSFSGLVYAVNKSVKSVQIHDIPIGTVFHRNSE